jgi:hypothetical protein
MLSITNLFLCVIHMGASGTHDGGKKWGQKHKWATN